MVPFTRVPFWGYPIFDPQPYVGSALLCFNPVFRVSFRQRRPCPVGVSLDLGGVPARAQRARGRSSLGPQPRRPGATVLWGARLRGVSFWGASLFLDLKFDFWFLGSVHFW